MSRKVFDYVASAGGVVVVVGLIIAGGLLTWGHSFVNLRPYRLRGSFVSLLLWEGRSLTYVAEQAGHSVATLARHYAGVLRELQHAPRTPADEAIRAARERASVATGLRQDGRSLR
jgi:hypothetical protein